MEAALHIQIDQYLENGKVHYANTGDPSIPAALSGIVRGFRGLHDFRLKPRFIARPVRPANTSGDGEHQIVPDDFATIYDVARLYAENIDGTGQKLVIVGQTDVNLSDMKTFRSRYGLPANDPQKILVAPDPGFSQDDLPEADLDLEWSGAVARNASIIFVYSTDVNVSLTQAIDQAYAPVISMSYGLCEEGDLMELPIYQSLALQANAEGITWFNAAGDSGAGDCEDLDATIAQDGLNVDAPASVPEVTAMGGSEFNEGNGNYWNFVNTATGRPQFPIFRSECGTIPNPEAGSPPAAGERACFFQNPDGKPGRAFRATPIATFPIFRSLPRRITMGT